MKTGNNWGIGVLIITEDNMTLMGKRTDNKLWCTPGGKVEVGETVLEGIIRETREESNLKIHNPILFDIEVGAFSNEKVWVTFSFLAKEFSGKEKPQESEMSELKWMKISDAMKLDLFEPTRMMIDKALKLNLIPKK